MKKTANVKFYYGKIKPAWYQELSDRQMKAADDLQVSIQEDCEQETIHRCQKVLIAIGIKPVVSPNNIRSVLQLCRGSDMAFLWMLLCMTGTENPTKDKKSMRKNFSIFFYTLKYTKFRRPGEKC